MVFVFKCCLNGCISVLYWFSEIVVSVRDEEVVNKVVVVGNILYKMDLNGYLLLFFINVILRGMLISGVSKLYKVRFIMKRLLGMCFKCLNL